MIDSADFLDQLAESGRALKRIAAMTDADLAEVLEVAQSNAGLFDPLYLVLESARHRLLRAAGGALEIPETTDTEVES